MTVECGALTEASSGSGAMFMWESPFIALGVGRSQELVDWGFSRSEKIGNTLGTVMGLIVGLHT